MDFSKFLRTGGRARIHTGSSQFQTIFNEVIEAEQLSFMIPMGYRPHEGDQITVTCITQVGLVVFDANVSKIVREGDVGVMILQVTGNVKRIQKRAAFRAKVALEVLIKVDKTARDIVEPEENVPKNLTSKMIQHRLLKGIPEGWIKTNTIDISETGMLVRMGGGINLSGDIDLIIKINQFGFDEVLSGIKGRLTRSFLGGHKETDLFAGIQFLNLSERDRAILMKVVFMSQREKKTRKWSEL